MVAFYDPPKKTIKAVLTDFYKAGIAMGKKGTEIAREAASLILTDAIAMGRRIYTNLKKAIQYIIYIHSAYCVYTIGARLDLSKHFFSGAHYFFRTGNGPNLFYYLRKRANG